MRSFRIRPDTRYKYYYKVFVFDTCDDMEEWMQKNGGEDTDGAAWCLSYPKNEVRKFLLGEILFSKEEISFELISHECIHAAMNWLRISTNKTNLKFPKRKSNFEERLAYTQMFLLGQVLRKVRGLKWESPSLLRSRIKYAIFTWDFARVARID